MKKVLLFISAIFMAMNVNAERIDLQDFTLTYIADATFQGMEYQEYVVQLPEVYPRSYAWTYEFQTNRALYDDKTYTAEDYLNAINNYVGCYPAQFQKDYNKKLMKTDVDTFFVAKDQAGIGFFAVCVYSRVGLQAYTVGGTINCPKSIGEAANNELAGPTSGAKKDLYDAIVKADDYTYETQTSYACNMIDYSVRHAQNLYEKYITTTVSDQEAQAETAKLKADFAKYQTTTRMQLNADYDELVTLSLKEIATGKKYEYIDMGKTIKTRVNSNNLVDVYFPALDFGDVKMDEIVMQDCDTTVQNDEILRSIINLKTPFNKEITVNGETTTCSIGSDLSYLMGDEGIINAFLYDEYMLNPSESPNKYIVYISYSNLPYEQMQSARSFALNILNDLPDDPSAEALELGETYKKYESYNMGYDNDLLLAAAQDLVDKIHKYQATASTGISTVTTDDNGDRDVRKFIANGRICISKAGNTYNVAGQLKSNPTSTKGRSF